MDAFKYSLLLLFLITTTSCKSGEDQSVQVKALVDQLVSDRIQSHKDIRLQRCREEMLREAGEKVDSILLEEARQQRDTVSRPPKPVKPIPPAFRNLPDSMRNVQKPIVSLADTLKANN